MGTVRFRRVNLRLLVVLAVIAIMATAAYGFAASNKFDTNKGGTAGDGAGKISGYTVSNVHYTMNTGNPALITSAAFHLDSDATSATVRFADSSGTFGNVYSCSPTSGPTPSQDWTCDVSAGAITVSSVSQIDVAAVN